MKNFIQFKEITLSQHLAVASVEINELSATLTGESPVLYTFLPTSNKVVVTVDDAKAAELGLQGNILRTEEQSNYPLGFQHHNLVKTKELLVGINSPILTYDDAVNYAAALIEANTDNNIVVIKLIDRKFTNKTYYVIPTAFSNSEFLTVDAVIMGNATLGADVADSLGAAIIYDNDGITI